MKKFFLCLSLVAMFAFEGCQNSSAPLLAYEDSTALGDLDNNQITQVDFFAKNLAVITEDKNIGGDELLDSGSTLLINVTDNEAIYADHVYDRMYPASLTKLLTALVVLKSGELTDSVTISDNAAGISKLGARVCGYEEGDVLSLEALLNSLLIYSGNDAAIAIAEHIGGSEEEFVKMMNDEASKIGAVQSNFVNSHGLHDDNQYTTAYDMYLIFNELLKYDTFRSIISSSTYTVEYKDNDGTELTKVINSTNAYMNTEQDTNLPVTIIGGLAGATNKAGSCMILLSGDNNNKEYISIILHADDSDTLYSQTTHLLSLAGSN